MRAVRRAEGIVHKHIGIRGELRCERRIILLLACMEAHVLEKKQFARAKALHRILRPAAECVAGGWNHHLQVIRESLGRGAQSQPVNHLPVWSS